MSGEIPSKSFCAFPFVNFFSTNFGDVKLCCYAKDTTKNKIGESIGPQNSHDTFSWWNEEGQLKARKQMLAGEWPEACEKCQKDETLGESSYRHSANWYWFTHHPEEMQFRIQEASANEGRLSRLPAYWDLRFSNLCNLKCRSCAPEYSSGIESEYAKIASLQPGFVAINQEFRVKLPKVSPTESWVRPFFTNQPFLDGLKQIKSIYLGGGEPSFIPENQEFLKLVVDQGLASQIHLTFNSNLSLINPELLELAGHFKKTTLIMSLDAWGEKNEYIRHGSQWNRTLGNLQKLLLCYPKFEFYVSTVIQLYNLLDITELWTRLNEISEKQKKEILIAPILLYEPEFLSVDLAPDTLRKESVEKIQAFLKNSQNEYVNKQLRSLSKRLQRSQNSDEKNSLFQFFEFTKSLDQSRGQDFKTLLPELAQHLV